MKVQDTIGDYSLYYGILHSHLMWAKNLIAVENIQYGSLTKFLTGTASTNNSYRGFDDDTNPKPNDDIKLEIECVNTDRALEILKANLDHYELAEDYELRKAHNPDNDIYKDVLNGGTARFTMWDFNVRILKIAMLETHFNKLESLMLNRSLSSFSFEINFLNIYIKTDSREVDDFGNVNKFYIYKDSENETQDAFGVVDRLVIEHSQINLEQS